jgi:hypothetical protein
VFDISAEVKSAENAQSLVEARLIVELRARNTRDKALVTVRGQVMVMESDSDRTVIFPDNPNLHEVQLTSIGCIIGGGIIEEGSLKSASTRTRACQYSKAVLVRFDSVKSWRLPFRPGPITNCQEGGYRLEREGDAIHAYGPRAQLHLLYGALNIL